MMQYFFITLERLGSSEQLLIAFDDDGKQYGIPADEGNADYREYLAWVAEGNTAQPWQPEEPVIEDAN